MHLLWQLAGTRPDERGVLEMRHVVLAATVAAVILAGALPATSLAAPVMLFGRSDGGGLMLRSNCISGRGPAETTIAVVWKRASGLVKANVGVTTNASGDWE